MSAAAASEFYGPLTEIEVALLDCAPVVLSESLYKKLFELGARGRKTGNDTGPFDSLRFDSVVFLPGGRFEFARDLRDASGAVAGVLVPARNEFGQLADAVAWSPDTGAFATWRNSVAMLGQDNLYAPRLGGPLVVFETILEWLKHGRDGVFILDDRRAALLFFGINPTLGVHSIAFGKRLRTALTIPPPRMLFSSKSEAA